MKKSLLLGAAAAAVVSASAVSPAVYENLQILAVSPDGKTAVSEYQGTMTVIDLESGRLTDYQGEINAGYVPGQGNPFTKDGILVGSTPTGAAYLKDGVWHALNVPNSQFESFAQGVTPDGSRIVGMVGMAKMSIDDMDAPMVVPAIWNRNADGTYGDCVVLPYPNKDFTGRVPQYVTAMTVSDDGSLVVGQIIDYSGRMNSIIYYTLGNDGKWEYNTSLNKLCNPDNLTFPEDPGEAPLAPEWKDFMTAEEYEEYQSDLQDWMASGTWDPETYPNPEDYASDEEKAAYAAAQKTYETEYRAWYDKFIAFSTVLDKCLINGTNVLQNNIYLSADKKSVISTSPVSYEDPDSLTGFSMKYTPVIINLETGEYKTKPLDNICVSSVTADGTILGWTEDGISPRKAMLYTPGSDTPISLYEYFKTEVPETADWMTENMLHPVEIYNPEDYTTSIVDDVDCTGTPHATPDMRLVVTAVENVWDFDTPVQVFSYVLPGKGSGIKCVADTDGESIKVNALKGGRIMIEGNATAVTVYDIDGRTMFSSVPAGSVIETGLASGTYIIKVTANDDVKTVKATF